ncbi:MotA/TolQ/ExbB proton channel family protein [Tabrizicola aquatica]|uniref:MotA/TolQ/ExbB proton channel family protein n=1 Tax=Tabrizicola aquatica TaxID=909926 RepID=UPI000CD1E71A|nr:MotA/TolQ/ExbB proton channel family protein [Tabrizicola aquatica]
MVRVLAACLILLAGTAVAQEGAAPSDLSSGPPPLDGAAPETEAQPLPEAASRPAATVSADGGQIPTGSTALDADFPATSMSVETDLVSLFLKAHLVVQAVMGALALAAAAVLTVFLFKIVEFALAFARLRRARAKIAAEAGLIVLPGTCPLALTSQAVADEAAQLPAVLTADLRAAARERLDLRLDRIEAGAVQRLRSGSGLLASIGSVGTFVGLFGTVFGIMNSFIAIAATKTTNLSVVAPGIAEALLATGIGLVAAIPAVLLYNAILRRIAAFRHALADARTDLLLRFSRGLDARMAGG